MSNVIQMPPPTKPDEWLVTLYELDHVIIDGRHIPRLQGKRHDDGSVSLCVDRRFMADFPDEEQARQAAWMIAQALAIGEGYAHLGAETKERPFAPQVAQIVLDPAP